MDDMTYVDGFVAAVPTARRDDYRRHAADAAKVFREHGALGLGARWGDGTLTSFPMAVKRQPDETVVFAWIAWPSKAVRDVGMAKVMADPRMNPESNPMPFDGQRMIFGGFSVLLQA